MMRPNARSPSITSQESFSAVMITDMVADVNVTPEAEDTAKSSKEETNLGFHMDEKVKKNSLEDVDATKVNGVGISKGVILNAVAFGTNDSKKTFDEKPMQLTSSLAAPTLTQPLPESKGFKDMTLTRKIAFCFSFLPSIFFVLCFAVILPCKVPKPCIEEAWIVTFNNTEPISRLELTDKIILTVLKEDRYALLELEKSNGNYTEFELSSSPAYLKCGHIMNETQEDCMVMDKLGKIYTFNDTSSKVLWDISPGAESLLPSPVILSHCNEKLEAIAVAVSNTNIRILHGGYKVSSYTVTQCDSVPTKLMSWKKGNASDIVFVCDKNGVDQLLEIPKSGWCTPSQSSPERLLLTGELNSLKTSLIKLLDDNSIIVWSGNEVSKILDDSNSTLLWTAFNISLPEENRFIMEGKFSGEDKHLALIGSSLTSGLQVTFLNPTDGSFVKKLNFENSEALEVMNIKGQKKDFLLLLLRKVTLNSMTAVFTQISDISSTIVSILSNEKVNDDAPTPTTEELAILDLEGNLDTVKEISDFEDSNLKTTMTAITDEDGVLSVYLLSMSNNTQMITTKIRNIKVANWDKSSKFKCLAK